MKPKRRRLRAGGTLRRSKRLNLEALDEAERYHCKAAGLIAGARTILNDFVGHESWGADITIDVASQLLREAKAAKSTGAALYHKATQSPTPASGRRTRAANKEKR